jgi:hypothetical protein
MLYPAPGPGSEPGDAAVAKGMVGKRLPIAGNVDISIIEEAQPRLLSFSAGALDYFEVPASLAENVIAGSALKPEFAKRGMVLHRMVTPSISFFFFNLEDPLVGGYTPEKLALRRAISMGFDRKARIAQVLNGQAIPAMQPVPPALYGHDPKYVARYGYDPGAARARCSIASATRTATATAIASCLTVPLMIVLASTPDAAARVSDDSAAQHGRDRYKDYVPQEQGPSSTDVRAGQLMLWGYGWISARPRAVTSTLISTAATSARRTTPGCGCRRYALVEESLLLRTVQRTALFDRMNDLVYDYAPWILSDYPHTNVVAQPGFAGTSRTCSLSTNGGTTTSRRIERVAPRHRFGRMTGLGVVALSGGSTAEDAARMVIGFRVESNVLSHHSGPWWRAAAARRGQFASI